MIPEPIANNHIKPIKNHFMNNSSSHSIFKIQHSRFNIQHFKLSSLFPMTSQYLLLALLFLAITFNSCKETDNKEVILTNPSMLLKTATQYQDGKVANTTTYEYDPSGRIAKISYKAGRYEKYSYVSDTIILKEIYNNEFDHYTDTLLLNDRGLVIAVNKSNAYEYDAEGYLVKATIVKDNHTYTTTHSILDGNMVENNIVVDSVGHILEIYKYEFSYNTTPAAPNTIGTENTGIAFWGKQSKNRPSRIHSVYASSPDFQERVSEYSVIYTLDRYSRIVKESQGFQTGKYYTAYTYSD